MVADMEVKYANLHMHSTYSDAGFSPEQLVRIGKAVGHKALALTDHETDGGCEEFMENCRMEGLDCVNGVEFYGEFEGRKMHITALDFDPKAPGIRNFIDERCRLQAQWTKQGFDKLKARGLLDEITWDEVVETAGKGAWICYDSVLNLLAYKHVYNAQRRPALVEGFIRDPEMKAIKPAYPKSAEIIRLVREAGGVVGVAHPVVSHFDFLEKLVDLGMNGLEVCHPSIDEEAAALGEELVQRRGLYRMGGTDHTGPMSANGGQYAVPAFHGISQEDFCILKDRAKG